MHSLTLIVTAAAVDEVCDALNDDLAALSVSIEDADAGSAAEQPVFDEPGAGASGAWQRATISALFTDEAVATAAATALSAARERSGATIVAIAAVDERDWVRLTQAQFGPSEIAPGFWIVPTWAEVPAGATRVIRLDPGRAFGTGTHPTTRMCLRWIAGHGQANSAAWRRVLDYGAGSGVLAIAAAMFGASDIDAVDVDPAAIEATESNALANGVSLHAGPTSIAAGRYSLIVANILAAPLKLLAPLLIALLDDDGTLVLSGILARQTDELRAAYSPALHLDVAEADDGWILLTGTRARQERMA
ncbi:MAG: 50S ribosomal protein L11 methyltransferase [Caldimonas sp.]